MMTTWLIQGGPSGKGRGILAHGSGQSGSQPAASPSVRAPCLIVWGRKSLITDASDAWTRGAFAGEEWKIARLKIWTPFLGDASRHPCLQLLTAISTMESRYQPQPLLPNGFCQALRTTRDAVVDLRDPGVV